VSGSAAPAKAGAGGWTPIGSDPPQPMAAHAAPDPKIVFDWEETRPGAGDCQAGRYAGTFTCNYTPAGADPSTAIEVTGPVEFELTRSQNGEFLEISQGRIEGFAALFVNFAAALSGKLDCSTNSLNAAAQDGIFGFGSASLLPAGTFVGTLTGMLDRSTTTLSGQWNITPGGDLAQGGECIGPWTAQWVP
jgi:hypothetical protein